jgi:hypothetical protein
MHQPILKRRPGKTTDHGAPPTKSKKPSAKMEPRIEAKVRDMLRDGMPVATIATVLCIGKTGIRRVKEQLFPRNNGTAIQPSRKTDFREVFRAAEAYRAEQLALKRAALRGHV